MDMEILEEFSASNDQALVKRKRTKRLRQSHSTSSSGGDGSDSNPNSLVSSSPTTSTSTEAEDEDIAANCLILLARGSGFSTPKAAENKFSSRKFTEMATNNGKAGTYVYECKTCNRTFPSFQALGGHRASHKKPKSSDQIDPKKSPPPQTPTPLPASPPSDDNQQQDDPKFTKLNAATTTTPPPTTQLIEINKHKIHECSICGSEFASGQALGGHMRRHRPVTAVAKPGSDSSSQDVGEKTRPVLALDLNLPAPPEDDRQDAEFHQFTSKPPPRLVFSAVPALVDCHY